jgi:DNA polymerase III epsilon subunit-like protein
MRDLIFVDTETTGFEDDPDATLVELTWAPLEGEPETLWFGVESVPPHIDELIGFTERGLAGRLSDYFAVERFLKASEGATMVAANPSFDKHFIKKEGLWRFHYRMLDIESYAYNNIRSFNDVPGMKDIYDYLTLNGVELTEPDHTSRNDVLALREAFLHMEASRSW